MRLENWWLIAAPFVFGLGWLAAWLDMRQLRKEQGSVPRSYFRGLNFLLNEQADQAIDAFVEVARLDPETIELHFALGNLFRRRGETERAIRVHQNLVNRPDLNVRERDHAVFELGQDFLKAGMLDRAETALASLPAGEFAMRARLSLLQLYELEKDWLRAIAAALSLQQEGTANFSSRVAQFYCEMAEDALRGGQLDQVDSHLEAALLSDTRCARAMLLLGDIQVKRGDDAKALRTWHAIPSSHQSLCADRVLAAYSRLGRIEEGLDWLRGQLQSTSAPDLLDIAFKYTLAVLGSQAAEQLAKQTLVAHPSLLALARLSEARLACAKDQSLEVAPEVLVGHQLLQRQSGEMTRYQCRHCGFQTRLFYWQCPGCAEWETFPPTRALPVSASSM
ncbi:MAG: lipopolysaccharide assembly protein LapB [Ottowia sp.]|nr:lipopolysaccharide assembly protein LapB [Ottowia sp.]